MTRPPRPAVSDFASLPDALVNALRRAGIEVPFPIQAATLPDALAGEHVLGRARTGAGKTLGFGLPMLARLAGMPAVPTRPVGLVLVPTRELAQQVADALAPLGRALGLRLATVYGGTSIPRQVRALEDGVHIVVATPGRLVDLLERKACNLSDVAITVLDEADHMCDLGFLPVVTDLLSRIPDTGQRMLFSATLDGDVDSLVRRFLPEPVLVAIDLESSPVTTMSHYAFEADDREAKLALLAELTATPARTLLFVRTKHGADRLARQLGRSGVEATALHGGMQQNARTRALRAFASGERHVLVATDVAARGIHVDEVDLVVHADPPTEAKAYLHRSGRTARAGAAGIVAVISLPDERPAVTALLTAAGIPATPTPVTTGDPRVADLLAIATTRAQAAQAAAPARNPAPEPVRAPRPKRPTRSERATEPAAPRPDRAPRADRATAPDHTARTPRSDRGAAPERGARTPRTDRANRPDRPDRTPRPTRTDRSVRPDRAPAAADAATEPGATRKERRAHMQAEWRGKHQHRSLDEPSTRRSTRKGSTPDRAERQESGRTNRTGRSGTWEYRPAGKASNGGTPTQSRTAQSRTTQSRTTQPKPAQRRGPR